MGAYIIRRLLISIPVLIGITIIGFVALRAAPGDPLLVSANPEVLARLQANPQILEQERHRLGFDQPIFPNQYLHWMGDILHGDLGNSVTSKRPVAYEIGTSAYVLVLGGACFISFYMVKDPRAGLRSALDVRSNPAITREEVISTGRSLLWMRRKDEPGPVDAAMLAVFADFVPGAIGGALGRAGGGNSLDNNLRIRKIVPTEWVLCEMQAQAAARGFGHGHMRLYAQDGTLMATASQSLIAARANTPTAMIRARSPGRTKATAKTGTRTMRRMVRALGRETMATA